MLSLVRPSVPTPWFMKASCWRLCSFILTLSGCVLGAVSLFVPWRTWTVHHDETFGTGTLIVKTFTLCSPGPKPRCWPVDQSRDLLPMAVLLIRDVAWIVTALDALSILIMLSAECKVFHSKHGYSFWWSVFSISTVMNLTSLLVLLIPVVANTYFILAQARDLSSSITSHHNFSLGLYLAYGSILVKLLSLFSGLLQITFWKAEEPSFDAESSISGSGHSKHLNESNEIAAWQSYFQFRALQNEASNERQRNSFYASDYGMWRFSENENLFQILFNTCNNPPYLKNE